MIYFGSPYSCENIISHYELKGACVGASFSINSGFLFLIGKLLGYKTIMWWTGTDALKYDTVWHWRLRFKLWVWAIDEHRVVAEHLKDEIPFKAEVVAINPGWIHYDDSLLQIKSASQRGN